MEGGREGESEREVVVVVMVVVVGGVGEVGGGPRLVLHRFLSLPALVWFPWGRVLFCVWLVAWTLVSCHLRPILSGEDALRLHPWSRS